MNKKFPFSYYIFYAFIEIGVIYYYSKTAGTASFLNSKTHPYEKLSFYTQRKVHFHIIHHWIYHFPKYLAFQIKFQK